MSTCSSCGHPIIWALTDRGKRAPYDFERVTTGTRYEIFSRDGEAVGARVLVPGNPGHQSHFATCPNADQHRRTP